MKILIKTKNSFQTLLGKGKNQFCEYGGYDINYTERDSKIGISAAPKS
jgi:hypothetical protein